MVAKAGLVTRHDRPKILIEADTLEASSFAINGQIFFVLDTRGRIIGKGDAGIYGAKVLDSLSAVEISNVPSNGTRHTRRVPRRDPQASA